MNRLEENPRKVKGLLIRKERHTLPKVIIVDLIQNGKFPFFLFICTIFTAVITVTTVYHTRLLTVMHDQLLLEHAALDIEWRNLILEENALGEHGRVERIAIEKLQLQHIDPSDENIIVKSKDRYAE